MLYVSFGFDCDIPRGLEFIKTPEGKVALKKAVKGLELIKDNFIDTPLTYFICGLYFDTLVQSLGVESARDLFLIDSAEIGNHGWSHDVVAPIPSRPDKNPLSPNLLREELIKTNQFLREILHLDIHGFRTPLGHFEGLREFPEVVEVINEVGFSYVSSDLRDRNNGLEPPLMMEGSLRQPYEYHNGLVEIPSQGWQDTAFTGTSKTPKYAQPPTTPQEILDYYDRLCSTAKDLAERYRVYYLSLVMHPVDLSVYGENDFLKRLMDIISKFEGSIVDYITVSELSV